MGFISNRVDRSSLKAGDHIYSWRAYIYAHHGIYVGDNKVIHFTRGRGQEVDRLIGSSLPTGGFCRQSSPCNWQQEDDHGIYVGDIKVIHLTRGRGQEVNPLIGSSLPTGGLCPPSPPCNKQQDDGHDDRRSTVSMADSTTSPSALSNIIHHILPIKLSPTNYTAWQFQFMPILKGHDLLGYIDGSTPCPPFIIAEKDGSVPTLNPAYTAWVRQDHLLLSWIYSSLTEPVHAQVVGKSTSQDLWTHLADTCASNSKAHIMQLHLQLHQLKKGSNFMMDYLLKAESIADQLAIASKPLDNDEFILYVLGGLGSEYSPFIKSMTTRDSCIHISDLQGMLLSEEICLSHTKETSPISINGGVISSCLDCFLAGWDLHRFEYSVSPAFFLASRSGTCTRADSDPDDLVVHRATYLLNNNGFGSYDVFKNNCEDFAIYCKTELLISDQGTSFRLPHGQASSFLNVPLSFALSFARTNMYARGAISVGTYCVKSYYADISTNPNRVKVSVEDLQSLK